MIFHLLFFILSIFGYAIDKSICLNMIVKNESYAIRKCLESVKKQIDYWVIIDTGSTDGTQEIIREILRDIPGELYESPWKNFEQNRNEALQLAKERGDYLLMIDADEFLLFAGEDPNLDRTLDKDCYFITVRENKSDYQRLFLINAHLPWRWEGVLHETLLCEQAKTSDLLEETLLMSRTMDGNRSQDPQKYDKDAKLLEEVLSKDPSNARCVFYLAQSYLNAKNLHLALQNYAKRAEMRGWDEEIFWSLYQIGVLQETLGSEQEVSIASFKKAFQYRPTRAEPLYHLANIYLNRCDFFSAYITAKSALSLPLPKDHIFVERWIYSYGLLLTLAHSAFELKFYREAENLCREILAQADLPLEVRKSVGKNLQLLVSSRSND